MTDVTNPTERYFKDGLWGWRPPGGPATGNWHPLQMIWGYTTHYLEALADNSAAAGDNTLTGSTVPAGEIWVVTNVDAANADTNITALNIQIILAATEHHIAGRLTPSKKEGVNVQGFWPMPPGAHVEAFFEGCVLNDDIHFHVIGYKMSIAE